MAGGAAVVNQRAPLFRLQELSDIWRADFQFERRGYTVERFHSLALYFLAVLVQVNESGSDHQPAGMDDTAPGQRVGRDANNLPVADANVAHCIEAGFGVHDTSAFEYQIVLLCGYHSGRER